MTQAKILNKWEYRQEMLAEKNKEEAKKFAKRKEKLKKHQEAHAKAVANSKGFTPGPVVKRNHQWPTSIDLAKDLEQREKDIKEVSEKISEKGTV